MIARDEGGVAPPHGGAARGPVTGLGGEAGAPADRPIVVGGGIDEQVAHGCVGGRVRRGVAQPPEEGREIDPVGREPVEQVLHQDAVVGALGREPELAAHAGHVGGVEARRETRERLVGLGHPGVGIVVEQRQQAFGEPGEVPLRDRGLVRVGVAALPVDGAEHGGGIVGVQERAGAVIDGFARDRHVVGVHDAVHEADAQPLRHERRLPRHHALQEGAIGALGFRGRRVVPVNRVVGQVAERRRVLPGREELESADADVARGHASQHRAGELGVAPHGLARGRGRERPGGGDAERRHGLADQVLAQHGAERRAAVAAARVRRAARALELDIAPAARAVHDLAQQDGPAVAELGHELAELVARVGGRERLGAFGHAPARQHIDALGRRERVRVEPEFRRQRAVESHEPGRGRVGRHHAGVEGSRKSRVAVVKAELNRHGRTSLPGRHAEPAVAPRRMWAAGAGASRAAGRRAALMRLGFTLPGC